MARPEVTAASRPLLVRLTQLDYAREMALIAREENDKLAARLKALEEKLGKA